SRTRSPRPSSPRKPLAPPHRNDGKPTPKRAILTLKTTDVRADLKRLRDKEVEFVGEIGRLSSGKRRDIRRF
ncbi:MAG TPA: hypothetical protein VEO18_09625, partial [Thermoplasmata archaeon]|nr:hypothetical protein [Thermoplasmata archaeon]